MSWLPKQIVLVPVDFSPASLEAVAQARTMVSEPSGLHVLHVMEPIGILNPDIYWTEQTIETRQSHVRKEMAAKMKELEVPESQTAILHGSPGIEIARYAEQINADLIVIASHGYTGIKHLLLGSVAERTARHAKCPVLILKQTV